MDRTRHTDGTKTETVKIVLSEKVLTGEGESSGAEKGFCRADGQSKSSLLSRMKCVTVRNFSIAGRATPVLTRSGIMGDQRRAQEPARARL